MRALWHVLVRTFFWSYERGTWPYDLMVLAIVLFVLLSPRLIHFNDQPQVGPPASETQVQCQLDAAGSLLNCRVDARLLASPVRTPELQRDLHEALRKNVQYLHNGAFLIDHIEPIRGESGAVIYYDVSVKH